ncbi:Fic family protein [Acinetobacter baumannii]|uniref:Fic/DOC family protein n=1 Tax=Acinetobacter baumannii TaxID=470 RepID=UPI0016614670|nr:Fic family protein [Acinetobacter baumannii]MBD0448591.1 hypothetical protein [Acinetobacter baumannii]
MSEYSDQERQEFYAKVKEILNEPVTSREQADTNTQLEYRITKNRTEALEINPIKGNYDFNHLAQIHHKLFDGIQDFAGKQRHFDIYKAIPSPEGKKEVGYFLKAKDIHFSFEDFTKEIKDSNSLKGLNKEQFVDKFTNLYANINEIHPFEEGNGRATKLMMKQLANEAGYQVNFDQVEKREWNYACKRALSDQTQFRGSDQFSMSKDIQLLKDVMNKIVHSLQIKQDNVIDEKETLKKTALDLAPNAQVHKASPGRYEGRIVAETENFVAQRLGDFSKHFVVHEKKSFDQPPKVNEVVSITHKANTDTAKVENMQNKELSKSKEIKR